MKVQINKWLMTSGSRYMIDTFGYVEFAPMCYCDVEYCGCVPNFSIEELEKIIKEAKEIRKENK